MYNTLKFQILAGDFRLTDMQQRARKLYAMGELTDDQLDELQSLIAEKANPEQERPGVMVIVQKLSAMVEALSERVVALESTGTKSASAEVIPEDYPTWEPWDGLSNLYQNGAVVTHNNQLWQSVFSGQNVWEPGTVDERFWVKYTLDS